MVSLHSCFPFLSFPFLFPSFLPFPFPLSSRQRVLLSQNQTIDPSDHSPVRVQDSHSSLSLFPLFFFLLPSFLPSLLPSFLPSSLSSSSFAFTLSFIHSFTCSFHFISFISLQPCSFSPLHSFIHSIHSFVHSFNHPSLRFLFPPSFGIAQPSLPFLPFSFSPNLSSLLLARFDFKVVVNNTKRKELHSIVTALSSNTQVHFSVGYLNPPSQFSLPIPTAGCGQLNDTILSLP